MEMVTHGMYFQHQSMLVAVSEKLPWQREGANFEDLFAVVAS